MDATTGIFPELIATNEGIFPVPEAPKPIPGLLLVHSYVVDPELFTEEKFTEVVESELQTVWFGGKTTLAEGLTVIVNVNVEPTQLTPPFVQVGVTCIVATEGTNPELVAVKDGIFPVDGPVINPIDELLLDHS